LARFIVTSLPSSYAGATQLYEQGYCARDDMENRIKEQQLGLFADRTSTPYPPEPTRYAFGFSPLPTA